MRFFSTAHWSGTYSYRAGFTINGCSAVPFDAHIRMLCNGAFRGEAYDHAPSPHTGRALVKGRFRGPRFIWRKVYEQVPFIFVRSDGGHEYVGDYIERTFHQKVLGTFWHPPVFYLGTMSEPGTVIGKWCLRQYTVPLTDGLGFLFPGSSGDFRLSIPTNA